jgi:ABC-type bacteriocin/lantibiotic exporter with double-glycine peptidase domain
MKSLKLSIFVVCSIFATQGLHPPLVGAAPRPPKQDAVMCGPNSIYILLALYGKQISFDNPFWSHPLHESGMSLQEVAETCASFGLPVDIRKCDLAELCENLQGPVIIYSKSWTLGQERHYAVILRAQGNEIDVMDSTTGSYFKSNLDGLGRFYLGYVIVPRVAEEGFPFVLWIAAPIFWLMIAFGILRAT